MTLELLFWILMLFWLVFGSWVSYVPNRPFYFMLGLNLLMFILFGILGYGLFGHIIKG
jgi:hypothetical protein